MQSAQQIPEQQQSHLLRSWQEALHRGWCERQSAGEFLSVFPKLGYPWEILIWKVLISHSPAPLGEGSLQRPWSKLSIPGGRRGKLLLPALLPGEVQPLTCPGCCFGTGSVWALQVPAPGTCSGLCLAIPGGVSTSSDQFHNTWCTSALLTTGEPSQAGQQGRNRWGCSGKGMLPSKSHQKYLFYEQRLISLICCGKKKKSPEKYCCAG